MILKSIYLHIGVLGLPPEYTYSFTKRSRYICNWIERELLLPLKFKSAKFDRLVVVLSSKPKLEAYINTSNVACVEIPFERIAIDTLIGVPFAKLQVGMLKSGIEKCATFLSIPKSNLLQGLDTFVDQGMKNEWLHKKRIFKEHNLKAVLTCKMTQDVFSLNLNVLHHNRTVFDKIILAAETDEIVFEHRFKDIIVENGNLVVTAKIGPPLWTKPIRELEGQN